MNIDDELSDQLALLRQQFANGLPKRFDAIDAALAACIADPRNETSLRALMTVLHSLGGAAGIFGFAALGNDARDAEHCVLDWIESGCDCADGLVALTAQVSAWRILA